MSERIKSTITEVLVTGLLALLATIGGGLVKRFWDKQLAEKN